MRLVLKDLPVLPERKAWLGRTGRQVHKGLPERLVPKALLALTGLLERRAITA